MNNTQAAQAARKIPFNPEQPLPPDVHKGLTRIVDKQLRHQQLQKVYGRGCMFNSKERA